MTVLQTARDAAYIAVGLGVLGFQKAQVARVDLTKSLTEERGKLQTQVKTNIEDARSAIEAQLAEAKTQLTEGRAQLAKAITQLEKTLEPVQKTIDARLDDLQDRLPGNVQTVVKQARERGNAAREQVKSLVAA